MRQAANMRARPALAVALVAIALVAPIAAALPAPAAMPEAPAPPPECVALHLVVERGNATGSPVRFERETADASCPLPRTLDVVLVADAAGVTGDVELTEPRRPDGPAGSDGAGIPGVASPEDGKVATVAFTFDVRVDEACAHARVTVRAAHAVAPEVNLTLPPHALDGACALAHQALPDAAAVAAAALDLAYAAGALVHAALPPPPALPDAAPARAAPAAPAPPRATGSADAAVAPSRAAVAAVVQAATPAGGANATAAAVVEPTPPSPDAATTDAPPVHEAPRTPSPALHARLARSTVPLPPTPPVVHAEPLPATPAHDAPEPAETEARVATARATAPPAAHAWRVAVGVAAAGTATGIALALAAIAMYQRVSRPRALAHPARAALHDALRARECSARVSELAREAGLTPKTAEYHLNYLARLGIVREVRVTDEPRRFCLPGRADADAPTPRSDLEARVVDAVAREPGTTAAAIARALGVTRPRVERRVMELLLAGRLRARVDAGARRLYATTGADGNR